METMIKPTNKEAAGASYLNSEFQYLGILIDKLKIEVLKLEVMGGAENFKANSKELLEKIQREIEEVASLRR